MIEMGGKNREIFFMDTPEGEYGFRKMTMGEKMASKKATANKVIMDSNGKPSIDVGALYDERLKNMFLTMVIAPFSDEKPTRKEFEELANPDILDELLETVDSLTTPKKKSLKGCNGTLEQEEKAK